MRAAIFSFLAALALLGALLLWAGGYDDPPRWRTFLDREGRVIGTLDPAHDGMRVWTPLGEIPPALVRKTLAAEDRFFLWHRGINPLSIAKAAWENLRAGRVLRGGSTITQQLAKNLLQEREGRLLPRRLLHKAREALLAAGIEMCRSKGWILERYLNSAYYGRGAHGIGAAAERFFGKRPSELSEEEAALLVRLPRAPERLAPAAGAAPRRLAGRHFIEFLSSRLGSGEERPRITTTLDLELERRAEEAIRRLLAPRLEEDPKLTAAAVVIEVTSGEILAMAGSRDYFDEAIGGAVNAAVARRQPGSALKPFTYFAAFAKGFGPETIVADEPTSFSARGAADAVAYAPQNFDRRFRGAVTIREALAGSYNVPAVAALNEIGISFYHEILRGFGFTTLDRPPPHYGLSITLGSGEVTLLELTNAYAALARGGAFLPAIFEKGSPPLSPRPVVEGAAALASAVTQILADERARLKAFGFNEAMRIEGHVVAVKTGTSYEHRDNWAVGYSPDYAVGVWVGHADGSPMDPFLSTGASSAAPIWHAIMEELLRGRTPATSSAVVQARLAPRAPRPFRAVVAGHGAPRGWNVTSPLENTAYRLHAHLPAEHQGIPALAKGEGGREIALSWYLDGAFFAATRGPNPRLFLPPEPGLHRLRAEDGEGQHQEVAFRVEEGL